MPAASWKSAEAVSGCTCGRNKWKGKHLCISDFGLREAGYSCGLFTSPHLVVINERFQINEKNIDNDTFLRAFEKVKKLADELVAEGSYHPTYFEFLFLMGMVIFAGCKCGLCDT